MLSNKIKDYFLMKALKHSFIQISNRDPKITDPVITLTFPPNKLPYQ